MQGALPPGEPQGSYSHDYVLAQETEAQRGKGTSSRLQPLAVPGFEPVGGSLIPDDKFQTTTQSWVPRQKHLTARSQMCLLPSNHLGAETFVLVEGDRAGILRKTQADPRRRDNPSV